ncbi:MAG TPA: hypothetical protein VK837_13680 [Longimicrobiales bacterium]|nr:hypothetical protein [Longimicrobiales bacterium]
MIAAVQALGEYGGLTAVSVARETAGRLTGFVFDHWLVLAAGVVLIVGVWKLLDA